MKISQWLYECIVFLLALLFLYTAFSKLMDMRHFVRAIHNQPFPKLVYPFLILGVPLVEIMTGVSLLRMKTRKFGLIASTILMFCFSIYVSLAVFHVFKRVPCGCAGVFQTMSWPIHLAFNIIFLVLACIGLVIQNKKKEISET